MFRDAVGTPAVFKKTHMIRYTYLLLDLGVLTVPLLASFHPRIRFYRQWGAFLPALAIVAFLFLAWDIWFTQRGYWGFNPRYVIGVSVAGLPLEEVLFFFSIPYACVFTFFCLKRFFGRGGKWTSQLTWIFIVVSLIVGVLNYMRPYTFVSCVLLALLLAFGRWRYGLDWLKGCYLALLFLLPAFLVVDGVLTGTGLLEPVVWYSSSVISGHRIGTIPIEDVPYGMELILLNSLLFYRLARSAAGKEYKPWKTPEED